jgi:chromosomal replication initiation ATPase DnaA
VSSDYTVPKPRQISLDLNHTTGFSRDELVVTRSNQAAVKLVDSWPQWPASFMVLAGPPGSGKSHLAAIWAKSANAIVLSGQGAFNNASDSIGNVLIDGLGEEAIDEVSLFHLINSVRENGASLLITSRRWPAQWPIALPDLMSRIKSAPTVEVSEPDDALLSGVITKLFADRQLVVEPHLVAYLVSRIERSLGTAQNVVARLDKAALEAKSRVSRQMASVVLTELDFGQKSFEL